MLEIFKRALSYNLQPSKILFQFSYQQACKCHFLVQVQDQYSFCSHHYFLNLKFIVPCYSHAYLCLQFIYFRHTIINNYLYSSILWNLLANLKKVHVEVGNHNPGITDYATFLLPILSFFNISLIKSVVLGNMKFTGIRKEIWTSLCHSGGWKQKHDFSPPYVNMYYLLHVKIKTQFKNSTQLDLK